MNTLRTILIPAHRCFGLAAGVLWLFQILSGCVLVFHHEIDNATLPGPAVALSPRGIDERIQHIVRDNGTVNGIWIADARGSRFDVYYRSGAGTDRLMRIDGAGRVLRDGLENDTNVGGVLSTLAVLHYTLGTGDIGRWVLTVSGLLLLTNVWMGLTLAWPRDGAWSRALWPIRTSSPRAYLYGIHRALGLWIVLPASLVVIAGVTLMHKDAIAEMLGVDEQAPTLAAPGSVTATPAEVLARALERYPGSTLTMLELPNVETPMYRVRLHAPKESPRMYGATTLYLSATNAQIIRVHDVDSASPGRAFVDGLYPFHTGQIGGFIGKLLLFITGVLLLTLGVFGLRMWRARRTALQRATD